MVNDAALNLLDGFEQLVLVAYKPVPLDPWTCGYGSTGPDIGPDTVWTKEQAIERRNADLAKFEEVIQNAVVPDLSDNQYGALVVLCYNIGASNFNNSTLLRCLNKADFNGVQAEWPKWNKAHGVVLEGLVRRRAAELALFMTPDGQAPT